MATNRALQQYKKDVIASNVTDADPHRLVQMLLEGALNNIKLAENYLKENNAAEKGNQISRALSILECLRASLNHEVGGDIANNLGSLYEYIQSLLLRSNLNNDLAGLVESSNLLLEIKSAWDAIAPEVKQIPPAKISEKSENQNSNR